MQTIAVYGTLKKGRRLHHLVSGYFKDSGIIRGQLYMFGKKEWGYPILTKGEGKVEVEIYKIPKFMFDYIKAIEEGAGYKTEFMKVNGNDVIIWRQHKNKVKNLDKINTF